MRVMLFVTPAPACAGTILALGSVVDLSSALRTAATVFGIIALIVAMGIFDGILSTTVAKRQSKPVPRALGMHVVSFVMIQFIFGPVFAVLFFAIGALCLWIL